MKGGSTATQSPTTTTMIITGCYCCIGYKYRSFIDVPSGGGAALSKSMSFISKYSYRINYYQSAMVHSTFNSQMLVSISDVFDCKSNVRVCGSTHQLCSSTSGDYVCCSNNTTTTTINSNGSCYQVNIAVDRRQSSSSSVVLSKQHGLEIVRLPSDHGS